MENEVSTAITFHDIEYIVTVAVHQQQLSVQVECEDPYKLPEKTPTCSSDSYSTAISNPCWIGQFSSNYIQDLTRKTGNFKRFGVFTNMLISAVQRRSEAVFIDLFTTTDLERFRLQKLGNRSMPIPSWPTDLSTRENADSKRYLILTYAVEFDRVHYPLPLCRVEAPDTEILQRIVRRLRRQLQESTTDEFTALRKKIAALEDENRSLKASTVKTVKKDEFECPDRPQKESFQLSDLQLELQRMKAEKNELVEAHTQLQKRSQQELMQLKKELQLLQSQRQPEWKEMESQKLDKMEKNETNELEILSYALEETRSGLKETQHQMLEIDQKNRELKRQLAIAQTKLTQSKNGENHSALRSQNAQLRSRGFTDSEDSDESNSIRTPVSSSARAKPTSFRRFDPTAYHRERQQRLDARRKQTPGIPTRSNPHLRAGYSSNQSNHGSEYTSASSQDSDTCVRSSRSRRRTARSQVFTRQRESIERLSSPKTKAYLPPRSNSVDRKRMIPGRRPPFGSRAPSQSSLDSDTASALEKKNGGTTNHRRVKSSKRISESHPTTVPKAAQDAIWTNKASSRTMVKDPPSSVQLADTSVDSFSDIDDRLKALQNFLRQAKERGRTSISGASAANTNAMNRIPPPRGA
uniref:Viable flagellar protein number 3 putative n=1 Tax=Albugo laibachii Nc14 TaxID=890382 RepID=F0WEX7_9STRA|nr:viable flagellar protein number 3 putative [Albugo laibachii Nc14]|eukprot:CCA19759.1 viable flagellar protein number 3 putative [Albugo laibachii Nc14]